MVLNQHPEGAGPEIQAPQLSQGSTSGIWLYDLAYPRK